MILQTAGQGRYASALLYKRYQILESVISSTMFFVADHELGGDLLLRNKKGDVLYFDGLEAARAFLRGKAVATTPPTGPKTPIKAPSSKESLAAFVRRLIQAGLRDEEIVQRAIAEKGMAPGRASIVAWYRRKLQDGA